MNGFDRKTVVAFTERLKEYYNLKTDNELAEHLEMTSSGLSAWKRRGSIDIALIINKCPTLSLDWLLHGVGLPDTYVNEVVENPNQENDITLEEYILLGKKISKKLSLRVTFKLGTSEA